MSWLLVVVLKNAILVLPLAALALLVGRWWRRPALAHVLWAIVLLKLLTPPLVDVPVGWHLGVESWLADAENDSAVAEGTAAAPAREGDRGRAGSARRDVTAAGAARRSQRMAQAADAPFSTVQPEGPWGPPRPGFVSRLAWMPEMTWAQWAGSIWLAGSLVVLAVLARRAWRFRRFLRLAVQRDEYLGVRVAELAHSVGMQVPPRVIVVDGIVSPMLWGLGEGARLIFPARLAKRMSPAKLDTLLLHELAHFSRKDHWLRALELAAWVVLWWHPLVWFARREIERTEEECCDAWVIEHQSGTRHSYAEALLTTVDFLCEPREALPPAACGLGEVALLRERLTQIVCGETAARLSRTVHRLVLSAGLLLAPLEPALWATSSVPDLVRAPKPSGTSAKAPSGATSAEPRPAERAAANELKPQASFPAPAPPLASVTPPLVLDSRPLDALWATAVSPNGKFRLEAKQGGRIRLYGSLPVDLSANQITCVSFAPDSRTFATGHEDGAVKLRDSGIGGLLDDRPLRGSDAEITSVQISPDGRRVAAGTVTGSVFIWDLATKDLVAHQPSQDAMVSCLRWSKAGDRLAIALGHWSKPTEAVLVVWAPLGAAPMEKGDWSRQRLEKPIGALEWLDEDQSLLLADWQGYCQVWNVKAGRVTKELAVEKDRVSAAHWSADCPLIPKPFADPFTTGGR
jgi:beta-lactamase regulating signal transducer with metallopeptidase domain